MRIADWNDYELIDTGSGERLERWGDILLIRPDPQIIWKSDKKDPRWKNAHARYRRSNTGGGRWEAYKKLPVVWKITRGPLVFRLKPMGFKHTGLFPEQAANWEVMSSLIKNAGRKIKVLNLFAYSGGATLAAAAGGAEVWHVDAAKGMVAMARENAAASGLAGRPVHWIVDDCGKFIQREIRRGRKYDGIVMDPPSYGRGPSGEIWKMERDFYPFLLTVREILSDRPLFVLINSYTTGLAPSVVAYLADSVFGPRFGGRTQCGELGLPVTASGLTLPCGATGRWEPGP